MARSRLRIGKLLARHIAWVGLAIVILGWGQINPAVFVVVMAIASGYIATAVPTWCGAVTRGDRLCRNNAHGILIGCHLREHKWQKLKLAIVPKAWSALTRRLWSLDKTQLAGLAIALGTMIFTGLQVVATVAVG